jgi:hypothetical protein
MGGFMLNPLVMAQAVSNYHRQLQDAVTQAFANVPRPGAGSPPSGPAGPAQSTPAGTAAAARETTPSGAPGTIFQTSPGSMFNVYSSDWLRQQRDPAGIMNQYLSQLRSPSGARVVSTYDGSSNPVNPEYLANEATVRDVIAYLQSIGIPVEGVEEATLGGPFQYQWGSDGRRMVSLRFPGVSDTMNVARIAQMYATNPREVADQLMRDFIARNAGSSTREIADQPGTNWTTGPGTNTGGTTTTGTTNTTQTPTTTTTRTWYDFYRMQNPLGQDTRQVENATSAGLQQFGNQVVNAQAQGVPLGSPAARVARVTETTTTPGGTTTTGGVMRQPDNFVQNVQNQNDLMDLWRRSWQMYGGGGPMPTGNQDTSEDRGLPSGPRFTPWATAGGAYQTPGGAQGVLRSLSPTMGQMGGPRANYSTRYNPGGALPF